MKTIDKNLDIQSLLAELKQLEQDLLAATNTEFPALNNDAYFKEIFAEINDNKGLINDLLVQNQEAEQELLLAEQEEAQLAQTKKQLYYQLNESGSIPSWKDEK